MTRLAHVSLAALLPLAVPALPAVGAGAAIGLLAPQAAQAKKDEGRPVTIRVVDEYGVPIQNARVRVPGTEGKTLVNRNGEWTEQMLYTVMGDEFPFARGETIEFHISAPEYHARSVQYKVRGRTNYVEVALKKMPEPTDPLERQDDRDLLIRWFQRTDVDEAQRRLEAEATAPPGAPREAAGPVDQTEDGGTR
jgi:hypothetical protein